MCGPDIRWSDAVSMSRGLHEGGVCRQNRTATVTAEEDVHVSQSPFTPIVLIPCSCTNTV